MNQSKKLSAWEHAEVWAGNEDRHDSMIDKPRRNNEFYMWGWNNFDRLEQEEWHVQKEV